MNEKRKSEIQELLATLYLRLNGYFTTGFIIQSSENAISGEVDLVAIRFPLHKQDETEHNSSVYLESLECIDIIVGEVKSHGESLQFNKSLRASENWSKLLRWIGLLNEEAINELTTDLIKLVEPKENARQNTFLSTKLIETQFGSLRVRPILFSLERVNLNNASKFVHWSEANDFIWDCLCPAVPREKCGVRYDFNSWGYGLNDIVKFYKRHHKEQSKPKAIEEVYEWLG